MRRTATIRKEVGETPLEALERWRDAEGIAPNIPLAYAGRLDPMASGKVLVLIGDECKRQTAHHGYDKEYRFETLLGFSTDTGDILGMAQRQGPATCERALAKRALTSLRGVHTFRYPRFSSRTVRGVPLHEWTLRGGLRDDEIPSYEAHVKHIRFLGMREMAAAEIRTYVHERIGLIPPVTDPKKALGADFRRGIIRPRWDELLTDSMLVFTVIEASAVVSSGTYIRTLAEELGRRLNTTALAYSIERTCIGTYHVIPFCGGFWSRQF